MKRQTLSPICAALVSLGVATLSTLSIAAEPTPSEPAEQAAPAEAVQPEVDKAAVDKALERRDKIVSEASAAIAETKKALVALEDDKTDEALAALEEATGKLELILARDPDLGLAPVDVSLVTYDLLADPETVKKLIVEAEEYLENGKIQKARPLVARLASEMVLQSTNIPLVTYPDAIKAVAPLIDEGKTEEAKAALQAALNTLVVTTDDVVPLPKVRAEHLLNEAEKLAEKKERTEEESKRLTELLSETRTQLKLGEVLGYGTKQSFRAMHKQLDEIEDKISGGEGGKGWFDKIEQQLSHVFSS